MLRERDTKILRTVVDAYVNDGVPVSSQRVREVGGYSLSTASIRNHLAALEKMGYLTKTHVSSGRVPTDEGYRLYVDELQANRRDRLDPHWKEVAARCRSELRSGTGDMSELMMLASHLLGQLSRNFAVVYGAVEQRSIVRNIRLVSLEGNRILVVVNMDPEYERTTTLRFDRTFSPDVVASCERLVSALVTGKSVDDARGALEAMIRDNVTDEGLIARELSVRADAILTEQPAVELYFEEREHLMGQPELSDPKVLQMILRLLHNKPYLTSILARRSSDRTEVTIGHEHDDAALWPFSLVTAGYRVGAARGVLGIIGPTRMEYGLALSLVGSLSNELREIGERYF